MSFTDLVLCIEQETKASRTSEISAQDNQSEHYTGAMIFFHHANSSTKQGVGFPV